MITTYHLVHKPVESPEEMKESIRVLLETSGVTNFTLHMLGVDVEGGRYRIEAEETDSNLKALRIMYGTENTYERGPQTPAMNARDAKKAFQIGGKEGRFAKENPTPDYAR